MFDDNVAAPAAPRTDRVRSLQKPGPRLEPEIRVGDGAHGARFSQASGVVVGHRHIVEKTHFCFQAALEEAQLLRSRHLPPEADTAGAQDAALAVQKERFSDRDLLRPPFLGFLERARQQSVSPEIILQVALARLVADGAVQGMVGQQELQHASPRFGHLFGLGPDLQAFLDGRGTGQLELGLALDLDQAHPAAPLGRKGGVIAEMGDVDPCPGGGGEQGHPLGRFRRPAVEDKLHHGRRLTSFLAGLFQLAPELLQYG